MCVKEVVVPILGGLTTNNNNNRTTTRLPTTLYKKLARSAVFWKAHSVQIIVFLGEMLSVSLPIS